MSWGKQVHSDLVRQQDDTNNNNIAVSMNGTNGNCSCHKQSHCNRLTCYRSHTRSGSITQLKVLPLFITMLILALAMPVIDAAVIKRSVAETNTIAVTPTINETHANATPAGVGEIDFTTVNTPLLANKQTIEISNESFSSEPTTAPSEMHISVEPETTTGSSTTITASTTTAELDTTTFSLHVPQNVTNDIHKTLNEKYEEQRNIKQIFIESKFDNTDAVLVGDLGNTLPDSIRNEIEGELEANAIPTDDAQPQVVNDQAEDILTQTTQHEGSTKLGEKVTDVLTEVTSVKSFIEPHQSVSETTESSTIAQALPSNSDQSLTASKALSIFFPLRDEETFSTTSKSIVDSERDPRNFNINNNGNVDILSDRSESDSQSMADTEMQNIEEDKNDIKEKSLKADKNMTESKLNPNSEPALHSPEANELKKEKYKPLDLSKIYENIITRPDEELQYDESMIILDGDENIEDDEEEEESLTENANTTKILNAGSTAGETAAANVNLTEPPSVVADKPSLSIVLNENLTASEPINAEIDEQPVDLLKLVETEPLLTEDLGTTVEPESVKNVHVVIKKQGVELDEALLGLTPVEDVEETTAAEVLVKKILDEDLDTTEKTLVTLDKDLSIAREQNMQNDNAAEEASTALDVVSEPSETNGEEGDENVKEISNEEDKLNNYHNQIDAANNTQAGQEEQREQGEQSQQEEQNKEEGESEQEIRNQQVEQNEQEEETTEEEEKNPSSDELNAQFGGKEDVLNGDKQFFTQTSNDIGNPAEKSTTTTRTIQKEEEVIVQDEAGDDLNVLQSSTQDTVNTQEEVDNNAEALQGIENNFTNEEMEKTLHSTSQEIEISKKETDDKTKALENSIEKKVFAHEEAEEIVSHEEGDESSTMKLAAEEGEENEKVLQNFTVATVTGEGEKKEKALQSSTVDTFTEKPEEHNSILQISTATEHADAQIHISLFSTTSIPNQEIQQISTSTAAATETHTTERKEFETFEDANNNTDDPDIVPLLVGVSTGQGDVTASTKGSRSINTQTHQSMLLTQMDDAGAATLFESFPPHNVGRTMNDHLADESKAGIGKVTSAAMLSRSGVIITVCTSIACMFLLASVVAFLISFQRQHGTLDIEMQEQRCGKDNLDEEDDEVGTCTKLLDIELPKPTIVSVSSEELEECL